MHDIRFIRDNPDIFDAGMKKRGLEPQAERLIGLDAERREATSRLQALETERNSKSKLIGQAKAKGDEAEFNRLRGEVDRLKAEMDDADKDVRKAADELADALANIPNLPNDGVPVGADESANVEQKDRRWGTPRQMDFDPKDHVEIGEGLKGLDFEKAAAISGARFAVTSGKIARLERALSAYMLDLHTNEHGYVETSVPLLVRDPAMFGTGQLPKFKEDLFRIADVDLEAAHKQVLAESGQAENAGESFDLIGTFKGQIEENTRWLIPTAEVPLTNLVRDSISDAADFPLRLTAHTPCFRSEAGSAGRDTRGLMRMHQFYKVEMVSIVTPEASEDELERMTGCAEKVLQGLELPYRVMLLSTGDMGFSARKTYDLEVWLPSQKTYREISSCSNCGDFQARRMNARFRREGEKKPEFLHTLNGSGVAVGRALLAVLENHQNADGSVTIPNALRPYMDGLERLEP